MHEGRLSATSAGIGHGSVFTIELPLVQLMDTEGHYTAITEEVHENAPPTEEIGEATAVSQITADGMKMNGNRTVEACPHTEPAVQLQSTSQLDIRPPPPAAIAMPPQDGIGMKRVLVVDDVPSNRKMAIRLLTRQGCECLEAEVRFLYYLFTFVFDTICILRTVRMR